MNEIKIYTQKELDDLPKSFKEFTQIQIFGNIEELNNNHIYNNAEIVLLGSSKVQSMYDSSQVQSMYDSSQVKYMYDSSQVQSMLQ